MNQPTSLLIIIIHQCAANSAGVLGNWKKIERYRVIVNFMDKRIGSKVGNNG